jgi:hypothetical protein
MSRALPWVANTSEEAWKILKCWQRLGKTPRPKNNSVGPPSKKAAASQGRQQREIFGGSTVALSADELAEWLQAEVLAGSGKERR